jgi:glutathione S-transferase
MADHYARRVKLTLYTLPGSHPCAAVEVALGMKSIEYKRVDLLPMSQLMAGPLLWGGRTVPGIRIDGERMVGSRPIMRKLDALVPDPALLPEDPTVREQVLEAEAWGDDVLQSVPRRIIDAGFLRNPYVMGSYAADAKLPLSPKLMRPAMPLTAKLMARLNKAKDETVKADLVALPQNLSRIDAWIADGLLGGEQPNAADLQIGSSIRLLQTIGDVKPLIDGRPAATLARYFPAQAGGIPQGTLPAEWLPV